MEGVFDAPTRELLTRFGGIDLCYTEFIRVHKALYPQRVFFRYCQELANGGKTSNGTPVIVQIMGSDPTLVAENAQKAIELGAPGVDLNFGCPAKTVNRRGAGASLLKEPVQIAKIVEATRRALPPDKTLSVKIRLGMESPEECQVIVPAIPQVNWICVHARTQRDGYHHPARWEWLAKVQEMTSTPIVANGDIWTAKDGERCRKESGLTQIMVARGLYANPNLAEQIAQGAEPLPWSGVQRLLLEWCKRVSDIPEKRQLMRLKQWVRFLQRNYPEAEELFSRLKTKKNLREGLDLF
jgi:tRNA-dihydrouridine synthase C